ncbi:MAG: cyclic pyranopterin monophosphate synthase MoaC [Thermoplasmatota archaeon]
MGIIDIGDKENIYREAEASGKIKLSKESLDAIEEGTVKKGDPIQVAEISAIQAVKKTPGNIPHCHPIPIDGVDVSFEKSDDSIKITCRVSSIYKTGVEMEALSGVNAALLTIWDMMKYLEKDEEGQYPETEIMNIKVTKKIKGKQKG